jgi:RND superfamily putative drug exporter
VQDETVLSPGVAQVLGTLLVTDGPLAGQRVAVRSPIVLGREGADLTIPDPELSRRHAVVRPGDGGLELEDLASANGTWLNGRAIVQPTPLRSGDVVALGSTSFRVELTVAADARAPALVVTEGPLVGRRLLVVEELVFGREGADVVIEDLGISRRHAAVRAVDGHLEVEDLQSTNGTWVNTRRIAGLTEVYPGDVIRLGRTALEVEGERAEVTGPAERLLARLADLVTRRRRFAVAIWAAVLLGCSWFSLHQSDRLSGGGWEVPGSESQRVDELLEQFPQGAGADLSVLVSGSSAEPVAARLADVQKALADESELRAGPPRFFERRTIALLPFAYTGPSAREIDTATDVRELVRQTEGGVETRVVGTPAIWSNFQEVSKEQLAKSEAIGFPLILLILLAGFGTLVAALAPLALGFVTVFLGAAVIYAISTSFEMSVYVTNMASMIGIGVAVDYSLFIVSHFRRELQAGATKEEAVRRAMSSAGTAVVFSGATVAVALAGLFLIDVNAIRSMAVGAIVVVVVAVLAAITLLPAFLALVGHGIERLRVRLPWSTGEQGTSRFWAEWVDRVLARPGRWLAGASAFMLLLAVPMLWMETGSSGLQQLPADAEVRVATERVAALAGPGAAGPAPIVVSQRAAADELTSRLRSFPGVAGVGPVSTSTGGALFAVDAVFDAEPESERALDTLGRLDRAVELIGAEHGADALVGGETARTRDTEDAIIGGLWKVVLFILAVSYLVLLVLLRSVLMPLKAVTMNLLSVGAAYGVLVMIFQWGLLDWTGYDSPGYIEMVVPPLLLAVTFGLSMDYEVFLLTRIRERVEAHGDSDRAVREGVVQSARIITSAALIMVAVFGAFAIAGALSIKQIGVGLSVAILLDATVVRLVIVPSTMRLLGDWNWWLPKALQRVLPVVSSEGSGSPAARPEASGARQGGPA